MINGMPPVKIRYRQAVLLCVIHNNDELCIPKRSSISNE